MKGKKSTKKAVMDRVNEVEELLSRNYPHKDILRYITEKYTIGKDQVEKDITKVNQKWAAEYSAESKDRLIKILNKMQRVGSKAFESGDFRTAKSALIDEAKLTNVYIEGVKLIKDVPDLTLEEIDELLKEKSKKP